ncbi:hypothetical protein QBC37DRAFT_432043 [Rhypophila decipiens]|uniref:Uncharacterized protein n=1 Tax=Rhypophila decipiens TaxID=261697 RepID=A0AAN7B3A9_9PEZI|nr:hypothetical protein QBC37DRAFT_432043 [Rhypophila decipiens]
MYIYFHQAAFLGNDFSLLHFNSSSLYTHYLFYLRHRPGTAASPPLSTTKTIYIHPIMNSPTVSDDPQRAAILVVNSGILPSAKDILPVSAFHEWYDKIHIRDLLLTDGVKSAFRFEAVAPAPAGDDDVISKRPFLAIYPTADIAWFTDNASPVWKVPVTSDMLPNESGNIFELADFQMGVFEKLVQVGFCHSGAVKKFIALVGINSSQVEGTEAKTALEGSVPGTGEEGTWPARSTLLKWIEYSPPGAPKVEGAEDVVGTDLTGHRAYLAVHEYDQLPNGDLVGKNGAPVFVFSSLSSSGGLTKPW